MRRGGERGKRHGGMGGENIRGRGGRERKKVKKGEMVKERIKGQGESVITSS